MAKTSTRKRESKPTAIEKRQLADEEQARLEAHRERAEAFQPLKFKRRVGGNLTLADSDDPLKQVKIAETFGTTDPDVQGHLFQQAVLTFAGVPVANHINSEGLDDEKVVDAANRTVAILASVRPRDELESMLAVQMLAVHNAAMHAMAMAMLKGQTFEGRKSNMGYATRLLQVFTSQLEALKKHRTGGQQKMIVEHVHVNEGGQAIVGSVNVGGGAKRRNGDEPQAA